MLKCISQNQITFARWRPRILHIFTHFFITLNHSVATRTEHTHEVLISSCSAQLTGIDKFGGRYSLPFSSSIASFHKPYKFKNKEGNGYSSRHEHLAIKSSSEIPVLGSSFVVLENRVSPSIRRSKGHLHCGAHDVVDIRQNGCVGWWKNGERGAHRPVSLRQYAGRLEIAKRSNTGGPRRADWTVFGCN